MSCNCLLRGELGEGTNLAIIRAVCLIYRILVKGADGSGEYRKRKEVRQMDLQAGKTRKEADLDRKILDAFEIALEGALGDVNEIVRGRGTSYDVTQSIVPRMAFGVLSWVQVVHTITNRLVALGYRSLELKVQHTRLSPPEFDTKVAEVAAEFGDLMLDLAAYATMALAWLKVKEMGE